MAKIRILTEQLANQIAAGEVVERPASVVKELVENSLDAGADRIEVEIEGGGTRLIRILDNGSGMDDDDVLLSFERHGTSKIQNNQDLIAIETLGFRGEAIPSIASVAKMSITSRPENKPLGTNVVFDFGKLQKAHETGCSQGTLIEVRNLFGNTPARRKFLRTTRTELGHIDEILKNYALASPGTAFSLKINGKETLSLGSGHDIEQRLRSILKYKDEFIMVGSPFKATRKHQLHGLLVPPERSIASSARLRLFINGRAIKDRLMSHAVFEGLRGFLLKGNGPAGYIHLRLAAEEVDVNVHPAKHEVRFRNSGDIHQFIKQKIEEAMKRYQQTIRSDIFSQSPMSPRPNDYSNANFQRSMEQTNHSHHFPDKPNRSKGDNHKTLAVFEHHHTQQGNIADPTLIPPIAQTREPQTADFGKESTFRIHDEKKPLAAHGMRIIGQYKNLYIFCQTGDNLLVIDQHAAHERILYEKFLKQFTHGRVSSQTLMFPQTIELSPFQTQLFESNHDEIGRLGFSVSEFGGSSYVISAVPALAGQSEPDEIFFDVLDGFGKEGGKKTPGGIVEDIIATMACKAAIKSGHELSQQEIDGLLNTMSEADLFTHCPHGRPVIKRFTSDDIKKWFYRT